jgi:HPt (histidine-containing phosphotransfer) domain-containing protein
VDTAEPFEERMRQLREGYISSLPARLEAMRMALRADDRATLQQEAHRLAGTGLSYGLPELTTWGREVERKCKAGATLEAFVGDLDALSGLIVAIKPVDVIGGS